MVSEPYVLLCCLFHCRPEWRCKILCIWPRYMPNDKQSVLCTPKHLRHPETIWLDSRVTCFTSTPSWTVAGTWRAFGDLTTVSCQIKPVQAQEWKQVWLNSTTISQKMSKVKNKTWWNLCSSASCQLKTPGFWLHLAVRWSCCGSGDKETSLFCSTHNDSYNMGGSRILRVTHRSTAPDLRFSGSNRYI